MEYLDKISDPLKNYDEENIEYLDLFDYPELFYGTLSITNKRLDFCKFPTQAREEMNNFDAGAIREMKSYHSASCGVRLRFFTNSKRIIFKIKLKRKYSVLKMVNWGSFGFDVYNLVGDQYDHRTVFAPGNGYDLFAESVYVPANGKLCIFLPNYNTIEEMYMGIDKGSIVEPIDYPEENMLPIIFYGNSVTQGAAASHSGNSFPNLVSKKMNNDIINISASSCCKGTDTIAKFIGKLNAKCIVIDYTRNAYTTDYFRKTHEEFYKNIRKYHPDTKIILMTSESFNNWRDYDDFDEIVTNTYEHAKENGDNTYIINQRKLFNEEDYDFISVDNSHYNDYGMNKIAERICEIIRDK